MFGKALLAEGMLSLSLVSTFPALAGVLTANGWYEGEEIYSIDHGRDEGGMERGKNDSYVIGGDRLCQATVVECIPGEAGSSPHWNGHVVHTADEATLDDILASSYASAHYPEALFDDVEDIRDAEAPGNIELSEDFLPCEETF